MPHISPQPDSVSSAEQCQGMVAGAAPLGVSYFDYYDDPQGDTVCTLRYSNAKSCVSLSGPRSLTVDGEPNDAMSLEQCWDQLGIGN